MRAQTQEHPLGTLTVGDMVAQKMELVSLRPVHQRPFGRVISISGDGRWAITLLMCQCMRPFGHYEHALETRERQMRTDDLELIPETDARRMINRHFPETHPHGYCATQENCSGYADFLTPERFFVLQDRLFAKQSR